MIEQEAPPAPVVLIVEDEFLIRTVLADFLTEKGLDVVEAGDAATALAIMTERPDVNLLFTDINMPGDFNGLDLARKIHHRYPDVLLMLTSGRQELLPSALPDRGEFIPKPYSFEEVADRVTRLLAATDDGF